MKTTATEMLNFIYYFLDGDQGSNIVTIRDDNLPVGLMWCDFVANLFALQAKGSLTFSVARNNYSHSAAITLHKTRINSSVPATLWEPTRDTVATLSKYGLTRAEITQLLKDYLLTSQVIFNDANFLAYSISSSSRLSDLLYIKKDWKPSSKTVLEIKQIGVVESAFVNYLADFTSGGKKSLASWDEAFLRYCKVRWSNDNRNPNATKATYMSSDWSPTAKTLSELALSEGADTKSIELMYMEYRLYWLERNEARANWDAHFKWWAKSKLGNESSS